VINFKRHPHAVSLFHFVHTTWQKWHKKTSLPSSIDIHHTMTLNQNSNSIEAVVVENKFYMARLKQKSLCTQNCTHNMIKINWIMCRQRLISGICTLLNVTQVLSRFYGGGVVLRWDRQHSYIFQIHVHQIQKQSLQIFQVIKIPTFSHSWHYRHRLRNRVVWVPGPCSFCAAVLLVPVK